ncbi:MAG: hypothetical protein ACLR8P_14045 [Clostridium fessum]
MEGKLHRISRQWRLYDLTQPVKTADTDKGVYMGGNIIVPKLSNLVPENIKEGEYVGGVGPGTCKGFVR